MDTLIYSRWVKKKKIVSHTKSILSISIYIYYLFLLHDRYRKCIKLKKWWKKYFERVMRKYKFREGKRWKRKIKTEKVMSEKKVCQKVMREKKIIERESVKIEKISKERKL